MEGCAASNLPPFQSSAAFTLVELLVVVAVISVLAALLLPSLRQAKLSARRTECANNMRQVGIAAAIYQGDFQGFTPVSWKGWRMALLAYAGDARVFHCPASKLAPWTGPTENMNQGSLGTIYGYPPYNYRVPHPTLPGVMTDAWHDYVLSWPTTPGTGWKDPLNSIYVTDSYGSFNPITYPSVEGFGSNHIHPPDNPNYPTGASGTRRFAQRHLTTNCLFIDGRVETHVTQELEQQIRQAPDCIWDAY
jgi:prepilin-type N-terminal cleavage/methylation domain-containing protein